MDQAWITGCNLTSRKISVGFLHFKTRFVLSAVSRNRLFFFFFVMLFMILNLHTKSENGTMLGDKGFRWLLCWPAQLSFSWCFSSLSLLVMEKGGLGGESCPVIVSSEASWTWEVYLYRKTSHHIQHVQKRIIFVKLLKILLFSRVFHIFEFKLLLKHHCF